MITINSTNKGKDLLFANKPRIVSWRTERMPQRIKRHSRITLYRSRHPKHIHLESGADSRMKKHSWNKDPERHFPRRCTIALLFIIAMMSLNHILRKYAAGYKPSMLCFDLLTMPKMPFKVVHRKEVTHPGRWKWKEVAQALRRVYITAWEFEGNIRPTNWGQLEIGEKEGKKYSGRRR